MRAPVRKQGERGFALLIVFLIAAAVALMLYQQMPRVAFETEREKEQMLQDRGKEYVRGIQLYYIAFKKYPTKIEDLENTNNKRFLRRRYIDPMTGKDEWRLIHVNAAGQLTDSVVQKPPTPQNSNSHDANNPLAAFGTGAGSTTNPTTGNGTDAPPDVNAAVARRPSDRNLVPPGGFQPPPANVDPNDPRYWPPTTLTPLPGANSTGQFQGQQFPGQQFPGQQFPGQQPFSGQQGLPGQQPFPGQQQYPGQQSGMLPGGFQPGLPGQTPFPGSNQNGNLNNLNNPNNPNNPNQGVQGATSPVPGGVNPLGGVFMPNGQGGTSGTGGANTGFNNPGFNSGFNNPGSNQGSNSGSNPASGRGPVGDIMNSLTTPNQAATGGLNAIGAGGLAGVASTYKGPSIKIYKDRQKYNEWEFIFDLKQATGQGQNGLPGLGQGGGPQNGGGLQNGGGGLQNGQQTGGAGTGTNANSNGLGFSPIFPTSSSGSSAPPGTPPIVH